MGRSTLSTIVGWAIVAVLAYLLVGAILGVVRAVVRIGVWLIVLGGLIYLYLSVRSPD